MTEQDLQEMGWNDVMGTLKRATKCTKTQKVAYAHKLLAEEIGLPNHSPAYVEGTKEAANAFIADPEAKHPFRGSADVVAVMVAKCVG